MRLLLVLLLSGCVISPETRSEIAARCRLGITPVIQDDENSPYVILVDGVVITIKCTEILE